MEETPEVFDAYTTLTVDVDDIKQVKGAFRLYPGRGKHTKLLADGRFISQDASLKLIAANNEIIYMLIASIKLNQE